MISYNTLLNEIEHLVVTAKNAESDQLVREQLSAIRALCNVALATSEKKQDVSFNNVSSHQRIHQPQTIISSPSSLQESRLQESDANGESIFDF